MMEDQSSEIASSDDDSWDSLHAEPASPSAARDASGLKMIREDMITIHRLLSVGQKQEISMFTLSKAIKRGKLGMFDMILRHRKHSVAEKHVMRAIRSCNEHLIHDLFESNRSLVVSDEMLLAALRAAAGTSGMPCAGILNVLLEHKDPPGVGNDEFIRIALALPDPDRSAIRILLEHWAGPPVLDDTVMDAMKLKQENAPALTKMLLKGRQAPVTDIMIEKSLCSSHPIDMIQVLFTCGAEMSLKQELVDRVFVEHAGNRHLLRTFAELVYGVAPGLRIPQLDEEKVAGTDLSEVSVSPSCQLCQTCAELPYSSYEGGPHITLSTLRSSSEEGCRFCTILCSGIMQLCDPILCQCCVVNTQARPDKPLKVTVLPHKLRKRSEVTGTCSKRCYLFGGYTEELQFYMTTGTQTFSSLIGPTRTVPVHRDATESFTFADELLKDCLAHHENCASPSDFLPTRVIRVGSHQETPRLYIPAGTRGRYAALSHCWGGVQVVTTTTTNVTARQQGFDMSGLPRTFQDAITITRRLGVEYLWIDSLCILQDDAKDWVRESAKMATIYSGAVVVIAADAASNGTEGCFGPFPRSPKSLTSVTIPCINDNGAECQVHARILPQLQGNGAGHYGEGDLNLDVDVIVPVSQRAWALQERLLATRILHYGYNELAWECWTHMRCECTESAVPVAYSNSVQSNRVHFRSNMVGTLALRPDGFDTPHPRASRKTWYALVQEYTTLRLTYQSDLLIAVSGLVQMHQSGHREYICGLWRDDFVRGLTWRTITYPHWKRHQRARQQKYIAPSWSWASIHGSVRYSETAGKDKLDTELVEVLAIDYTLASSNIYGAVTSASVTMSGSLLPILLDEDFSLHLDMSKFGSKVDIPSPSAPLRGDFELDVEAGDCALHETITQKQLFLLIVMTSSVDFTPIGIVLRVTGEGTEILTLERIGFWRWSEGDFWHHMPHGVVAEVAAELTDRQIFKII